MEENESHELNLNNISYNENSEPSISYLLSSVLISFDKQSDSLWTKLYMNTLPPALCNLSTNITPRFYRAYPNLILKESKEYYLKSIKNKRSPINFFMLAQYYEYIRDNSSNSKEAKEIYKLGASQGDPFCMTKLAEYLVKENEKTNRENILIYLIRSFIITGIEPQNLLNPNILISSFADDSSGELNNIDSFWYLSYYFDLYETEFQIALDKAIEIEKCSTQFKECIVYIFRNLHVFDEHVNILKMLEEASNKFSDKKAAFHFCTFSFLIIKISGIPINIDYIISVLKYIADDNNYFACEKLAIYLDGKQDYFNAFTYFNKAAEYSLPNSLDFLAKYYSSFKNPMRSVDLKAANDYWRKTSYFGMNNSIEYLKLLKINNECDRLFSFSSFAHSFGVFGSDLILGECYEKGIGTARNLKIASTIYKKGMKKYKEGPGFLYRLARIHEKEGNLAVSNEYYKVCYRIYHRAFEEDKNNSNNMWVLDAYRLASMYAGGRGVRKDLNISISLIDFILNAKITQDTSPYICIYFYILATKKRQLYNRENISSLLSITSLNSVSDINNKSEEQSSLSLQILKERSEETESLANRNMKEIVKDKEIFGLHNSIKIPKSLPNTRFSNNLNPNKIFNVNIISPDGPIQKDALNKSNISMKNDMPEISSTGTGTNLGQRTASNLIDNKQIISKIIKNSDCIAKEILPKINESNIEITSKKNISLDSSQVSRQSINDLEIALINQIKLLFKKSENQTKSIQNNTDIILIEGLLENIKKSGIAIIDLDDVVFDELIGNGGYSKVYSGWYKNEKFAIKEFKSVNEKSIKKIFEEINIQGSLNCNKINKINYLAFDVNPLKICCVNKFVTNNLRNVLNKLKLNNIQKFYIAKQILEAVDYMHSQAPPIVHRDIKPENILINDSFQVELCDFGVFKALTMDKTIAHTLNQFYTVRYSAPEIIKNSHFICKASDMWSIGLVLYDIFYEQQPWGELSSEEIIDVIRKDRPFSVKKSENVPCGVTSLIKLCTQYDYSLRPKSNDLLKDLVNIIYELNIV